MTGPLYKDENFLWSGFYINRSRHGNLSASLRFLFIFVFLCTRSVFLVLRNLLREYVPSRAIMALGTMYVPSVIASIMAKFEQILWERFGKLKYFYESQKHWVK